MRIFVAMPFEYFKNISVARRSKLWVRTESDCLNQVNIKRMNIFRGKWCQQIFLWSLIFCHLEFCHGTSLPVKNISSNDPRYNKLWRGHRDLLHNEFLLKPDFLKKGSFNTAYFPYTAYVHISIPHRHWFRFTFFIGIQSPETY